MNQKIGNQTNYSVIYVFILMVVALLVIEVMPGTPQDVLAETKTIYLDVPAQGADAALRAFAAQTNWSLMYSAEKIGNPVTNEVKGWISPSGALEKMLKGTGLTFKETGENTVSIQVSSPISSQIDSGQQMAESKPASKSTGNKTDKVAERAAGSKIEQGDYTLEDTVVTATKTGETKIQTTPIAINAFSKESLQETGITDVNDLDIVTPNFKLHEGTMSPFVTIRGVGSIAIDPGGNDAVGIYVDDAYTQRYTGLFSSLLDVERVEVLRGPQGTLYGRNTSGGAVRILTGMPTEEFSGYTTIEYGTQDRFGYTGALSGPITEKLKARVAFMKTSREGFFDNDGPFTPATLDPEDKEGVRAKLQFTPSDNMDFLLSGEVQRVELSGGVTMLQYIDPAYAVAMGATPWKPLDYYVSSPVDRPGTEQQTERWGLTGNINLTHDILLKSITSYGEHHGSVSETDGTTLNEVEDSGQHNFRAFNQEFQLNGKWGALSLVGGLFYLHEQEWSDSLIDVYSYHIQVVRNNGIEGDSYGAYLSGRYGLTDRLFVSAGIRYCYDERKMFIDGNRMSINVGPGVWMDLQNFSGTDEDTWSDLSPKLGLDYQLTEDAFIYASITKGFKAGGWDLGTYKQQAPYDPEYVLSYELGAKTDWIDKRLRANLTLFYYDYKDMQQYTFLLNPITGLNESILRNATSADLYGGELELMARPVSNLTMGVSVAATFGEYASFKSQDLLGNPVNLEGNELVQKPEWSITAMASYVVPVKDYGYITLSGNYSWQDKFFSDALNTESLEVDARTTLNARIMFETEDGKWFLDVYGRNLTDERYYSTLLSLGGPIIKGYLVSDGINFGANLGYRF
jgi:iron complex outermembrane recepter protein